MELCHAFPGDGDISDSNAQSQANGHVWSFSFSGSSVKVPSKRSSSFHSPPGGRPEVPTCRLSSGSDRTPPGGQVLADSPGSTSKKGLPFAAMCDLCWLGNLSLLCFILGRGVLHKAGQDVNPTGMSVSRTEAKQPSWMPMLG